MISLGTGEMDQRRIIFVRFIFDSSGDYTKLMFSEDGTITITSAYETDTAFYCASYFQTNMNRRECRMSGDECSFINIQAQIWASSEETINCYDPNDR